MTKVKEADDSSLWRETLRLVLSSVGLFTSYSVWGYLQEKISSQMYGATTDSAGQGEGELWHFPYVLNGAQQSPPSFAFILPPSNQPKSLHHSYLIISIPSFYTLFEIRLHGMCLCSHSNSNFMLSKWSLSSSPSNLHLLAGLYHQHCNNTYLYNISL